MAAFKLQAGLRSQSDRIGPRSISESKSRGSAARTKAQGFVRANKKKVEEIPPDQTPDVEGNNRRGPLPYGSNLNASTHSHIYGRHEVATLAECAELVEKYQSHLSNIANVQQLNMVELRERYAADKAAINQQFRTKYGDRLSGVQDAERTNALAKKASKYWISQAYIEITSNEAFEGAEFDSDRNLYVWRAVSKAVFTKDLLNPVSLPKTADATRGVFAEISLNANWNESTQSFDRVYPKRAAG